MRRRRHKWPSSMAPTIARCLPMALMLVAILLVGLVGAEQPPLDDKATGIPAAFGDFDSDKLTDVFTIGGNGRFFTVLRGYKNEPLLRPVKSWQCDLPKPISKNENIVSLMPADFHGMAMMDVLVVTKQNREVPLPYSLYMVKGDKHSLNCSQLGQQPPLAQVQSEPLLFDYNNDMITDILVVGENGTRYVWLSTNGSFERVEAFGNGPMRNPNSNAFVDTNEDDLPDVFITQPDDMAIWPMELNGFETKNPIIISYPSNHAKKYGQSTFVDINSDGHIDHIMPVCIDSSCDRTGIMALDRSYQWQFVGRDMMDVDNSSSELNFVPERSIDGIRYPMTLRQADVDGDGYPDLLALMKNRKGQEKIVFLRNIETHDNATDNFWHRRFVPHAIIRIPDGRKAVLAAFFDLYEDGKVDFLIASIDKNKETQLDKDYRMHGIVNWFMDDACFLKVMVASGLCFDDCSRVKENSQPLETNSNSPVAYGTNQPGPNVCYELIGTEGNKRTGCAGQLTQSASFALQMPYIIFGLGSTPNFIDTLSATIPSPGIKHKRQQNWTQIVPDSQVVLIPYPPDTPKQWRSKLFITPSDIVLSTLITLACICCLLILIIAVLHRKEILEDLAEHEEYKRHWPDSR